jgi:REP element-mobilizing transposase RayT
MPPRPPIDPHGYYHVGSRGCYGRVLFATVEQHEVFLRMYLRVAAKYGWETLSWALMSNHHHFAVRLTAGRLSEGMRELHSGYSRWIHELYGETREGHLFRHAFFARCLETDADVLGACCYIDLNPAEAGLARTPEDSEWCSYRATVGLEHPRRFHMPAALLELIDERPRLARTAYRRIVHERLAQRRQVPSPNDVNFDAALYPEKEEEETSAGRSARRYSTV